MRNTIECCKGCAERHFDEQGRTCHSTCEKYIGEKKALIKSREKIKEEKDLAYMLGIKRIRRFKKMN